MNNIKMLYFDRIDVCEGVDVKKSKSNECDLYHYWSFLSNRFKFQPNLNWMP